MKIKYITLFFIPHVALAQTIYGIENIPHYQYIKKFPVYVQTGIFKIKHNAQNQAAELRAKNCQYVTINLFKNNYKVVTGPFNNQVSLMQCYYKFHGKYNKPLSKLAEKSEVRGDAARIPISQNHKKHSQHWYLTGQLGGQFINSGSSATVNNGSGFSSPYDLDTYSANSNNASVLLGVGFGKRFTLERFFVKALSIGVHYQYFFANNIEGKVTQFSLPQFVNYSYAWPIAANVLIANGKFNFQDYKKFSPYFSFGIGGIFQQGNGYNEQAYPGVTPRISPAFAGNDKAQFAYLLGAGLDYPISNQVILSAGYQFSGLGKAQSGNGQGSWSGEQLKFGNLNSNAFVFSATYLFDADFAHFKLFNNKSS